MAVSPIKQQCKLYSYQASSRNTHPSITLLGTLRFCSDSPLKCWNCNYMYKSELFCSKCKVLQELPQNLNYFDIMGIKKNYNVINEELHKKYRELQKMLHPDKFGNKSEAKGISISEETTNLNPEFLMEIMERNEEIENAMEDKDKVFKLAKESKEMLETLSNQAAEAFKKKDIETATKILIKMKYYDSIDNRLKRLKYDLGIVE
ncbi:Co-chaperone protein HscB, mitochondrial [Camponotus floridanus]|uniref:Co-chaperone protein HscB, mitochondrial n=1 Tax=Camponotus floridanus TaxID=104421 RepID=E2B133_CAMFO|nr:Co-chaperone protein HscB, mitochondrial [Camponotus floridanus]